jgi:hypothetical protein
MSRAPKAYECSQQPAKEGNSGTGAAIGLTVLFGPIGLIKHGSNIDIAKGTAQKAYAGEDASLVPVVYSPQDLGEDRMRRMEIVSDGALGRLPERRPCSLSSKNAKRASASTVSA